MLTRMEFKGAGEIVDPGRAFVFIGREDSRQAGFALIMTLAMMSLVLGLILTLTAQIQSSHREVSDRIHTERARLNAKVGLSLAIADLQRHAGADRVSTAPARVWNLDPSGGSHFGKLRYTGVWDHVEGGDPVWLVSRSDRTEQASEMMPTLRLVGENSVGSNPEEFVDVEMIELNSGQSLGGTAYWVQGLNSGFGLDVANSPHPNEGDLIALSEPRLSRFWQQTPSSHSLESFFSGLSTVESEQIGEVSHLLFQDSAVPSPQELKEAFYHLGTSNFSVLTDSLNGGLRENLSDRNAVLGGRLDSGRAFDPTGVFNEPWADHLRLGENDGGEAAEGLNKSMETFESIQAYESWISPAMNEQVFSMLGPIVTEVSFRIGVFHARSDWRHRIRFHADIELWNPYPFPIKFPNGSSRALRLMLVPTVYGESLTLEVKNLDTGSSYTTDLLDFDESFALGTGSQNTLDEKILVTYLDFPEDGIGPGEVVHLQEPSFSRGLGRTIADADKPNRSKGESIETIDILDGWVPWDDPEYSAGKEKMLGRADTIELTLTHPPGGLTFRLIPYVNENTHYDYRYHSSTFERERKKPVIEIRGVRYSDGGPKVLRGDEYSRATSGSYLLDNYQLGYWIRLIDDSPTALAEIAESIDLRDPVIDFNDPEVARVFEIENNPWMVAISDSVFVDTDLFADPTVGKRGPEGQVFFYDNPSEYSITLRDLAFVPSTYDTPFRMIGEPSGGGYNAILDQYFLNPGRKSKDRSDWDYVADAEDPLPNFRNIPLAKANVDLRRDQTELSTEAAITSVDGARSLLRLGGFNINTVDPEVWQAVLQQPLKEWHLDASDPSKKPYRFENSSFQFTGSAVDLAQIAEQNPDLFELAKSDSDSSNPGVLADDEFERLPLGDTPERHVRVAFAQGCRELRGSAWRDLSVELVKTGIVAWRNSENRPFRSLSEFADSGILDAAIEKVDLNQPANGRELTKHSPAYITQGSLLARLSNGLFTRSDTFRIRTYGEARDAVSGEITATAYLEAEVQRIPERVDGKNDPSVEMSDSGTFDNRLGRRFVVRSIRWLSIDEI